jgi:hypothetical protein
MTGAGRSLVEGTVHAAQRAVQKAATTAARAVHAVEHAAEQTAGAAQGVLHQGQQGLKDATGSAASVLHATFKRAAQAVAGKAQQAVQAVQAAVDAGEDDLQGAVAKAQDAAESAEELLASAAHCGYQAGAQATGVLQSEAGHAAQAGLCLSGNVLETGGDMLHAGADSAHQAADGIDQARQHSALETAARAARLEGRGPLTAATDAVQQVAQKAAGLDSLVARDDVLHGREHALQVPLQRIHDVIQLIKQGPQQPIGAEASADLGTMGTGVQSSLQEKLGEEGAATADAKSTLASNLQQLQESLNLLQAAAESLSLEGGHLLHKAGLQQALGPVQDSFAGIVEQQQHLVGGLSGATQKTAQVSCCVLDSCWVFAHCMLGCYADALESTDGMHCSPQMGLLQAFWARFSASHSMLIAFISSWLSTPSAPSSSILMIANYR